MFSKLVLAVIASLTLYGTSQAQNANYGERCSPDLLLGAVRCNTFEGSVHCLKNPPEALHGVCECNLGVDNAEWNEDAQACLGKVRSPCLRNPTSMGKKICVEGADCFVSDDGPLSDGPSVGACKCMYGWTEVDRKCTRDESIPNPSTPQFTTTRRPLISAMPPTPTTDRTAPPASTTNNPGAASTSVVANVLIFTSLLSVMLCYNAM